MIDFTDIITALQKGKEQCDMIYNYTIPQAWDTFGYEKGKRLRNHEMMVNPYDFYHFALSKMLMHKEEQRPFPKEKGKPSGWIKQEILYDLDLRTLTSWDHDRDDRISHQNLYHMSDSGTFLKATILLPLLKRSGVTTLILHQLYALDQKRSQHDYSNPWAVLHPLHISEALKDPLLQDIDENTQLQMFMEMAHRYGMRVIVAVNFARMGRNNDVLSAHPDWFYWIRKDCEGTYRAPQVKGLPRNCIPTKNACKLLYKNEDTKQHMEMFVIDPKTQDPIAYEAWLKEGKQPGLNEIEEHFHITTAPMFSDQINSDLPSDKEMTYLRFYQDQVEQPPYLLQDTLRPDLFPGKLPMVEVWDFLTDCAVSLIQDQQFDGIFFHDPWLLPQKLMKSMIQKIRKVNPHAAILVVEGAEAAYMKWKRIGVDGITSDCAYKIHDVMQRAYHNFAYGRIHASSLVCSASEFLDTPRITQYEGKEVLAKLLLFMNLFLPNTIPYMASGQLSLERQPQYLSPFANQIYQNALPKEDIRCYKQAMLDKSFYTYTRHDFHVFINQMERFTGIRTQYLAAITKESSCIPVWFDLPSDAGIGFTYTLKDRALLAVCNTDIYQAKELTIHTENMLWELPFVWKHIHQIYSSHDPYTHEIQLNAFQNIPLYFAAGEVKLLEITPEKEGSQKDA